MSAFSPARIQEFVRRGGAPGVQFATGFGEAARLLTDSQIANQIVRQNQNQAFTQATGVDPNAAGIPQTVEQGFALANQRNEDRFQQGLQLFDQMQANAAQLGQTRRQEIEREDIQRRGEIIQSQIDRGIFNSSGLDTTLEDQLERRRFQETALDEALLQERNRILGDRIGFIERRTDAAPDPALFANLQRAASSAPSGSGGGGFSISSVGGTTRSDGSPRRSSVNNPAATPVGSGFGNLVRRNPGASNPSGQSGSSGSSRSSQRNQALENFSRRGINFGGRSNSQIETILRNAGVTISSADQVNRLSQGQLDAIRSQIRTAR